MKPATLFEKVWRDHVAATMEDGTDLLHIDRHFLHEMTSFKGFDDLHEAGRSVRSPKLTVAFEDHMLATEPGRDETTYDKGAPFFAAQRRSAREFGIRLVDVHDPNQGIVHVVAPELGLTLPGFTVACGDSHTCTNGAFGAIGLGIGSSDVGHVLATQTLALRRPQTFRITFTGRLPAGVYAKDMVLHLIRTVGAQAGNGFAAEYAGSTVQGLGMEARLTLCNMSVEWGARIGMIAPDDTTFAYLAGRAFAPKGADWDRAVASWRELPSDDGATFDREVEIDVSRIAPQVSWGVLPEHSVALDEPIPDSASEIDQGRRDTMRRAYDYMGLVPGTVMEGLPISQVFIGSCTNSRLSDLREAADIARGRKVAAGVRAMVVPGSSTVKRQAEAEGLDRVFEAAGFEWHESACSLCAGVNADFVAPRQRCVSTSNRNYEGRQGRDARTHLASPAVAAASALAGHIADPRKLVSP